MEHVYVMTLAVHYDKPKEYGHTGWHKIDQVFESLEDCQKHIDKEYGENYGFEEVSEGLYTCWFVLDRSVVSFENNVKKVLAEKGDTMIITIDKVEFIRKGKV